MAQPTPEIERRQQFAVLLNARGLKGNAVEIGTDRGVFAKQFIHNWGGENLICVDPWGLIDFKDRWVWGNRTPDLLMAAALLAPYAARVSLRQSTSAEAAAHYDDGLFDFVYIDADHSLESVAEDIGLWWPKLQPAGILAGHDYDGRHPGVIQAVDEFAAAHTAEVWLTNEPDNQSWYIYKTKPARMFQSVEHVLSQITGER